MEWIKAKYDRALLGFCGAVALIIGALLLMKALGWKKQFAATRDVAGKSSEFATSDAGKKVDSALAQLKTEAKITPPVKDERPISLFTSSPVMKVASEVELIAILDPRAKQVRPPVSNKWLYDNDLDIRQVNIVDIDSDGDNFTNREEFEASPQTNPRDAASHPPVSSKIQYREVVQEKLSLRMNAYSSPTEVSFRVTTASPETSYTTKMIGPGGKIQSAKGGEDRFTISKIDATTVGKEFAVLEDLKTKAKDIKAVLKEEVNFPTNRAKIVSTLGKEEEKVVSIGEEFAFEIDPEQKYTVKDITPEAITLEYSPKDSAEKKTLTIKIQTPP